MLIFPLQSSYRSHKGKRGWKASEWVETWHGCGSFGAHTVLNKHNYCIVAVACRCFQSSLSAQLSQLRHNLQLYFFYSISFWTFVLSGNRWADVQGHAPRAKGRFWGQSCPVALITKRPPGWWSCNEPYAFVVPRCNDFPGTGSLGSSMSGKTKAEA